MSIEAVRWALNWAPVEAKELPVLLALADQADNDGRGAWPSVATVAWQARKSERQVKRDIATLVEQGVIQRGNQDRTLYLPRDRRPVVYDLRLDVRRAGEAPWREHRSGRGKAPAQDVIHSRGVTHDTSVPDRGDTHDTPVPERGVTHDTSVPDRGDTQGQNGVSPMTPNPPLNPPLKTSSSLSSSSPAAVPAREEGEESQHRDNPATARVDGAAVAASLLGVDDAGWRRLGNRQRANLALAVQRLVGEGAHPDALPAAVRAAGPLDGPDVKSPAAVLLYRLGDLDASALTEAPRTAVRPSEGNSAGAAAGSRRLCRMGSACRDGQWVCDLDCPDACTGRHEPRGRACPDCASVSTVPAGPTFEGQLTKAMGGRRGGLTIVNGDAA